MPLNGSTPRKHRLPEEGSAYVRCPTMCMTGVSVQGVAGAKSASTAAEMMDDLLRCFQGEFDNYNQVVADRSEGLNPGPGGGHEHFHCSLREVTSLAPPQITCTEGEGKSGNEPVAVMAAKYYFNGDPSVVFRYRLYSFHAAEESSRGRGPVEMRLWRLLPLVEQQLKAVDYHLAGFSWARAGAWGPGEENAGGSREGCDVVERMQGCEIYWSRALEGEEGQASVGAEAGEGEGEGAGGGEEEVVCGFLGLMGENDEGTWISSQNVPGLNILVKDDLRLWPGRLWVNDRGYDRHGDFVYGNQRGVPYKLEATDPDHPLGWTLGEEYRTPETYAEKMAAIGVTPGERFFPPLGQTLTIPKE
ncbi:unnamed protein product [Discosporangium mesarthrocarpum]